MLRNKAKIILVWWPVFLSFVGAIFSTILWVSNVQAHISTVDQQAPVISKLQVSVTRVEQKIDDIMNYQGVPKRPAYGDSGVE